MTSVLDTYNHHRALTRVIQNDRSEVERALDSNIASRIVVGSLTALAFVVRMFQINHPDQVV